MKNVFMPKTITRPNGNKNVLVKLTSCRTGQMGRFEALGACLAADPGRCKYALPAIGGTFCNYKK